MRLIDADKLQEFPIRANRCDKEHANTHFINGIESVMEYAELLPTVDAVPVMRCKGCEHAYESFGRLVCGHSIYTDCLVREDFFCADGVTRKENEKKEGAEC